MTAQETITIFDQNWQAQEKDKTLPKFHLRNLDLQEPLVTIIVPTHNRGQLISETIDSILDQTHENLEIIIVDDCSTDNTEEVVRAYREVKYVYQAHEGNYSQARAINIGLSISNGDYIVCLEAGDTLIPTYVEKCLRKMNQDSKVGIIFTGTKEFGDSHNVYFQRELRHKYSVFRNASGQKRAMMVKRALYFSCESDYAASDDRMFPDSDYNDYFETVCPQSSHKLVGLYDENLHSLCDWDFSIRASLKGWKIVAIQEILHEARVHADKVSPRSDLSALYAKYPVMRLYMTISRGFDAAKNLFSNPKVLLHKL